MSKITDVDVVLNYEEVNRLIWGKVLTLHHIESSIRINLIFSKDISYSQLYTMINRAEDNTHEPNGLYELEI